MARETQQPGTSARATLSGRVFISGVGFIVTSAMWALIGFVRYQDGQTTLATFDLALVIAHIIVGALILRRVRISWVLGLTVAVVGMAATFPNDYYLPLLGDGVTGLLLVFSRADLMADDTHVDAPTLR